MPRVPPRAPRLPSSVKLPAQACAVKRPESERDGPTFQVQLCPSRPNRDPQASASLPVMWVCGSRRERVP